MERGAELPEAFQGPILAKWAWRSWWVAVGQERAQKDARLPAQPEVESSGRPVCAPQGAVVTHENARVR